MLAASTVPPTSAHVSLRPATKKSAGPRTRRPIHTPKAVMPIVYASSKISGIFTTESLSSTGWQHESDSDDHPLQVSTDMVTPSVLLLSLMTLSPQASQQSAAPQPKPFDCTAPEHRQFDFWVGEWDVVPNPETRPANAPPPQPGRKPATNIIEKAHRDCVIVENWDDGQGGTGQSFNVYDRVKTRWQQTWVDSNGGLHEYWGELRDGNMVYIGEVPLPPASRF